MSDYRRQLIELRGACMEVLTTVRLAAPGELLRPEWIAASLEAALAQVTVLGDPAGGPPAPLTGSDA